MKSIVQLVTYQSHSYFVQIASRQSWPSIKEKTWSEQWALGVEPVAPLGSFKRNFPYSPYYLFPDRKDEDGDSWMMYSLLAKNSAYPVFYTQRRPIDCRVVTSRNENCVVKMSFSAEAELVLSTKILMFPESVWR